MQRIDHELARLRLRHGRDRSLARSFPTPAQAPRYPSLGTGFAPISGKRELPANAKAFPVGHLHKQGMSLITPDEIRNGQLHFYGGKKP